MEAADPKTDDTRRDWEIVQSNTEDGEVDVTERLRIQNGWLYRVVTSAGVAVVFVPGVER